MGMMTTAKVGEAVHQAKNGQGETNERLEALIREQQQTNALLQHVLAAVSTSISAPRTS